MVRRATAGAAIAAATLACVSSSPMMSAAQANPAKASPAKDDGPDAGTPPCVAYWTKVLYRNYGYDHWVVIRNDCSADAECRIETNVNPDTIEARIAAESTKEVLTFRGSPSRNFQASVSCRLKR